MTTHTNKPETYQQVYTNLAGSITVSTVNVSNIAATSFTVETVMPMSSGWLIHSTTYSYDGILHTESYISDI